jgi:hypothetical protein
MSNDESLDDREFLGNICPHLKPLVESMLAGGAHVVGVTTILGTRYALELTKGLTASFAAEQQTDSSSSSADRTIPTMRSSSF